MRTIGLCLLLITLTAVTGCWTSRFPYMGSFDRHNWISTPTLPLTVTLKDVVTGEELLKIDIPVRMMLVMDLDHKQDWTPAMTNALPAEKVEWEILEPDTFFPGQLANRMELPGNDVLIVVTVRETQDIDVATNVYQPMDNGRTTTPAATTPPTYTPQGPATREVTQPQPQPQEAPQPRSEAPTVPATVTDSGVSAPQEGSDLGATDAPRRRTPDYIPQQSDEPADTSDLEGVLD